MTITRTFSIDVITPEELASVFAEMWAEEQAAFFGEVGRLARAWPGAGMCNQARAIAPMLTSEGRYVIERLADHAGLIPEVAS